MIETISKNKYSFNMRVSVKAMAAPDRDGRTKATAVAKRLFEKTVQSTRVCRDGTNRATEFRRQRQ
jgi:hypothetical protein